MPASCLACGTPFEAITPLVAPEIINTRLNCLALMLQAASELPEVFGKSFDRSMGIKSRLLSSIDELLRLTVIEASMCKMERK